MPTFPTPETGILLTHFIVTEDIAGSRDFYADVLGGEVVSANEPAIVELAGTRARVNTPGDPAGNAPATQVAGPAEANRLTDS